MAGDTLGPQAPALLPTRSPVSPGHVLGLTASLLPPGCGAPQSAAGRHVGAGGGPRAKHQGALGARVEILPGQLGHLGASLQQVVPRFVPQTRPEPSTEHIQIKLADWERTEENSLYKMRDMSAATQRPLPGVGVVVQSSRHHESCRIILLEFLALLVVIMRHIHPDNNEYGVDYSLTHTKPGTFQ